MQDMKIEIQKKKYIHKKNRQPQTNTHTHKNSYQYCNYSKLFLTRKKNCKIIGNLPMTNMFSFFVLVKFISINSDPCDISRSSSESEFSSLPDVAAEPQPLWSLGSFSDNCGPQGYEFHPILTLPPDLHPLYRGTIQGPLYVELVLQNYVVFYPPPNSYLCAQI